LTTQQRIDSLLETVKKQSVQIDFLLKKVDKLELELAVYKNKKNSNNSHIAPSKDENRVKPNQSLRFKSDKNPGGQPGHPGKTLKFSYVQSQIDEFVEHVPDYCNSCGKNLYEQEKKRVDKRQIIDIPPIKPVRIEHQIFSKTCTCGCVNKEIFPINRPSKIQYGPNVEATIAYLSTRQYLPYQRMQEFFSDVMNLSISQGGIASILQRFTQKSTPFYLMIKQGIERSTYAGTDETGIVVNGLKYWGWCWQNRSFTYITITDNRGFKTIEDEFINGLPNTFLGHDRYAAHFKCQVKGHQICIAHLLRDLNYIEELYKCEWAKSIKTILAEALELKNKLLPHLYKNQNIIRQNIENRLDEILKTVIPKSNKKALTLQKQLIIHQQKILLFLHHPEIPPDNNGSQRAIRNIKVKQKISRQFKSTAGADAFAVIRSVMDTTIKSGKNIFQALFIIALQGTE
jgi:transposase